MMAAEKTKFTSLIQRDIIRDRSKSQMSMMQQVTLQGPERRKKMILDDNDIYS